ncbi:MAG: hypothetical protein U0625_13630 [Phycisphaerales bacterium]
MRLSHRTSPRASVVRVLRTDRDDAQPNRATSARGLIAACAFLFVGVLAAAPARAADAFDAAAKLVPGNAASAILLPSPKGASDDLQQAIDRMGRAETGLGGRPIDLLKAWLGFGAGFDDRGAVALWLEPLDQELVPVIAVPVTDAKAFIAGNLTPQPEMGPDAYRANSVPMTLFAREAGAHLILAQDARSARNYDPKEGLGPVLAQRLGARGAEIARRADLVAWAGDRIFREGAEAMKQAPVDPGSARALALGGGAAGAGGAPDMKKLEQARDRGAEIVAQIRDGVVAFDFDALAVGVRAFARFAPESEVAKAMQPAGATPRAPAAALGRLPANPYYGAAGFDFAAVGGIKHVQQFLATVPGAEPLQLPPWLDAVQDKVTGLQVAAYPSKLGVLAGGLFNDAAFVVECKDPAAVKEALHQWILGQAGEREGVKSEAVWEAERELKSGARVTAFALKETVTGGGGDPTLRLLKQVIVGARGLHGFAKEVPGALVVTYSQRTDVLDRAVAAASGGADAKTLAQNGVVRSMQPWLVPDPDLVVFLGVGELLDAARQVAGALPGGAGEMLPEPPAGLEPVAGALRAKGGDWEAALVVPSSVLALGFDAMKARMMQQMQGGAPGGGGAPAPAPVPAPVPAPKSTSGAP